MPRTDAELNLPQTQYMLPRNEADFYGATSLIAEKLGLDPSRPPRSRASWLHFPLPDWVTPEVPYDLVNYRTFGVPRRLKPILLPTSSSQEFMRKHGYRMATAVGAPLTYALEFVQERIPGSRLIMPEHTLSYVPYSDDARRTVLRLVESAMRTRDAYSYTAFCLHPDDVRKGLWPNELDRAGIPWVSGAERYDLNALRRIVAMLSQFEQVLTNNFGSHIVYAWYLGCAVRLAPVGTMIDAKAFEDSSYVKNHPLGAQSVSVRLTSLTSADLDVMGRKYGLCGNPLEARVYTQLARTALGSESMRSPEEMRGLLGWRRGSKTWVASMSMPHDALARNAMRSVRRNKSAVTSPPESTAD